MLVVRDLGIQVSTRYRCGLNNSQFIDRGRIADVIINEGIRHLQVVYYLAIVVTGETNMIVAFSVRQTFVFIIRLTMCLGDAPEAGSAVARLSQHAGVPFRRRRVTKDHNSCMTIIFDNVWIQLLRFNGHH